MKYGLWVLKEGTITDDDHNEKDMIACDAEW
jgi:hypothetical protein